MRCVARTDSPDLSLDVVAESGAHCNLHMAFCCVQHLSHRLQALGHPMSVESMRRQLNTLQYSVLVKSATDEKYAMPSRASAQAKRICRSVSLSWNESPFRLKAKDGGQAKRVRKRK